jgi:hypothetical protein
MDSFGSGMFNTNHTNFYENNGLDG